MPATMTKCQGCEMPIEIASDVNPEDRPTMCPNCETLMNIVNRSATLLTHLQDFMTANPDGVIQKMMEDLKAEPLVAKALAEKETERSKGGGDLPGMNDQLTTAQVRASELAAAQDQKEIIANVVKDRETSLTYSMKEESVTVVKINDSIGLKRTFRLEELERIKTKKGGND